MESSTTLLIRSLPKETTNAELRKAFREYGIVKKCLIVRDKSNYQLCSGNGYVTYASREEAENVMGQTVRVRNQVVSLKFSARKNESVPNSTPVQQSKGTPADFSEKRDSKKRWKMKKPRLIVRNLSFKLNEDGVRKAFAKFGEVTDVTIPKNNQGRMKGFAFVQFSKTSEAVQAIKKINLKEIAGRPVAVDFAVPKDTWIEKCGTFTHSKELDDNEEAKVQTEPMDHAHEGELNKIYDFDSSKKDESSESSEEDESNESLDEDESNESLDKDESIESLDEDESNENSDEDSGDSSENDNEFIKNDFKNDSRENTLNKTENKRKYVERNTGNTLFVRNISFMSSEEEFREVMEKHGSVVYALLCLDPETELPKGTGFVRFKSKEEAQVLLQEDPEGPAVMLGGRRLYFSPALNREEASEKQVEHSKKKKSKDNRNLYLAREGLIRQGSLAAEGVSKMDLVKRAGLESRKKKLLQLLHYFVSPTRLAVYNLPPTVNDSKLKKLFLKALNEPQARITESRIMRNRNPHLSEITPESKGFG